MQALDLVKMHEELSMLYIEIEEIHSRSFPTYPIIENILVKEVPNIKGTKGKEKTIEADNGEKPKKKKKRRKENDNIELVIKASV